jgi:hypothetical protein
MVGFLQKMKYLASSHTYSEINAVSNRTNLIDYKLLTINNDIPDLTVTKFIDSVFLA